MGGVKDEPIVAVDGSHMLFDVAPAPVAALLVDHELQRQASTKAV